MQENQGREQYFFEDDTLAWLTSVCAGVSRVAAVFMPSLRAIPNVWVFDADERFEGSPRYTRIDVTKSVPDLGGFDLVLMDPPFLLGAYALGRLLIAARGRPVLVSASDWCVARAGWDAPFRAHGLVQVTAHFPRYRSIGNGYCEDAVKRDGRTNISFFSNASFAPPKRPIVLVENGRPTTYDPYHFGVIAHDARVVPRRLDVRGQVPVEVELPLRTRLARLRTRLRLALAAALTR